MNLIIALVVAGLFGVSAGFSFGLVAAWRALKQRGLYLGCPLTDHHPDDDSIDQAATEWAQAHGQPAAAPLIARKLRLLRAINERRSRGWLS